MGQIKNIKLHIVTDIKFQQNITKIQLSVAASIPAATETTRKGHT